MRKWITWAQNLISFQNFNFVYNPVIVFDIPLKDWPLRLNYSYDVHSDFGNERQSHCTWDSLLKKHMHTPSKLKSELHFTCADFTSSTGLNSKLDIEESYYQYEMSLPLSCNYSRWQQYNTWKRLLCINIIYFNSSSVFLLEMEIHTKKSLTGIWNKNYLSHLIFLC